MPDSSSATRRATSTVPSALAFSATVIRKE